MIERKIKHFIAEIKGIDEETIHNSDTLDGLGLDSFDKLELLVAVEEEFNIDIPDDEAELIQDVKDMIECIREHLN